MPCLFVVNYSIRYIFKNKIYEEIYIKPPEGVPVPEGIDCFKSQERCIWSQVVTQKMV